MALTHAQLNERLATLEAQVFKMMQDRNTFPRAFEDQVETLMGEVDPQDEAYAHKQLEAIVERSGFNR